MVAMGRFASSSRRFLCLGFLLTISLNCHGFLSGKTVSPGRQRVRPCEAMPEAMPEERKFSNERLRAETEDPFAKVKVALFGFLTAGAGVGLLFILPRLLGTLLGAPRASPLEKVLTDLGINFTAMIFLGFLTYQEWNGESVRSQAKEEGALIARLPVQVNLNGKDVDVKLSDLRNGRQLLPRRPVICIGNEQFCLDCIDASQKVGEAMARCDFLLIPVLSTTNGRTAISEAAKGKSFVALPKDSEDWQLLQEIQLAQVKSQGLDEATGQAIIVKKNGRVGTRFLGVPDWNSLTQEVDARVQIGLDTDNI